MRGLCGALLAALVLQWACGQQVLMLFLLLSFAVCFCVAFERLLSWRIPCINSDNKSGALEFSVPEIDGDSFFPIQVTFDSASTLSQIAITGVVQAEAPGQQVQFNADTQMSVEKYTIE